MSIDQPQDSLSFLFFHSSRKSKKQEAVSHSSAEAECRVLFHTTADSDSAIKLGFNVGFYKQTKHLEVDCHFVHHYVQHRTIQLSYIPFNPQHRIVEGDFACVSQWTSNSSNLPWHLADLIEEVIELSRSLTVSFHHTKRTANYEADLLAKERVHRPDLFISVQL